MNDFTLSSYSKMVLSFKERGYTFLKFQDTALQQVKQPAVLLRHDIDFSLRGAVQIAEIEHHQRVVSTYFVQLRSPLYNSLSEYARHHIRRIHDLGHDIALHFDLSLYPDGITDALNLELGILRQYYPFANTHIVSFHRPGSSATELANLQLPGGIWHTYERRFFQELGYFSDSRGEWRHGHPAQSEAFKKGRSMQIVTHPMWWTTDGETPIQKLGNYVQASAHQMVDALENTAVSFSLEELRSG